MGTKDFGISLLESYKEFDSSKALVIMILKLEDVNLVESLSSTHSRVIL